MINFESVVILISLYGSGLFADTGTSIVVEDTGTSIFVGDTGISVLVGDTGISIVAGDTSISIVVGDTGISIVGLSLAHSCRSPDAKNPKTIIPTASKPAHT